MSVQETNIIDIVSLGDEGTVVLSVSDHLDWGSETDHLYLLQEKINTYCNYVGSGQLYDEYPKARDRSVVISVVLFFEPTPRAVLFFDRVKKALDAEGYVFGYKMYEQKP
jgi:hypothetical protein